MEEKEYSYERLYIRRRLMRYGERLEVMARDVERVTQIIFEEGHHEKAQNFFTLYLGLTELARLCKLLSKEL